MLPDALEIVDARIAQSAEVGGIVAARRRLAKGGSSKVQLPPRKAIHFFYALVREASC
jgi:hypothetical protein